MQEKEHPSNKNKNQNDIEFYSNDFASSKKHTAEGLKKIIAANTKTIQALEQQNEYFRQSLKYIEHELFAPGPGQVTTSDIIRSLGSKADHPNFPFDGSLLDQANYYQEVSDRFWSNQGFKQFVIQIVGPKAEKQMKHLPQKLNYYLRNHELISMKYHNSKFYNFYCTNPDWIQNVRKEKGKWVADIVPGHEPPPELLKNLSDEQKSTDLITWSGLPFRGA